MTAYHRLLTVSWMAHWTSASIAHTVKPHEGQLTTIIQRQRSSISAWFEPEMFTSKF